MELEVLSFGAWIGFWSRLGAERSELEAAWSSFVYRYLAASCTLPAALHRGRAIDAGADAPGGRRVWSGHLLRAQLL